MPSTSPLQAQITACYPLPELRAGSALLRMGQRLLAVQDDAWSVAWITLPERTLQLQRLQGTGQPLSKAQKPDFEAAAQAKDGSIYLFGSGSTPERCTLVRIQPQALPARAGVELLHRPALYAAVRAALALSHPPNIEAALLLNDRLRLFHRGAGTNASARVDLALTALRGGPATILAVEPYELGQLDGIPLHLTDVAQFPDGRTAFLATAEQTMDAVADGPVAGSVIGLFPEAEAGRQAATRPHWARLIDPDGRPSRRKAEGLSLDDDGQAAWILTDPDASDQPAELCRLRLDGFACTGNSLVAPRNAQPKPNLA